MKQLPERVPKNRTCINDEDGEGTGRADSDASVHIKAEDDGTEGGVLRSR